MSESEMKQGDQVWFFDNLLQEIVVGNVDRLDGNVGVLIRTDKGPSSIFRLKQEVFPTREALCEHYRKIFE